MSQWFVEISDEVQGPFTTEAIQNRLVGGQLKTTDRIWGRMLEEWRTVGWWQTSLNQLSQVERQVSHPEVWHYAHNGTTFGPLAWPDLVHNLKTLRASSIDQLVQIMIWTRGMKDWAPVTDFHEIMDALGVNKREAARAKIQGQAVIKSLGNTYIAPLRTVSEGGFGCDPVPGLFSGEVVTVEFQCGDAKEVVHAKAQVQYVNDGAIGFRFTQLNVESRGIIVQYVKKSSSDGSKFFLKSA